MDKIIIINRLAKPMIPHFSMFNLVIKDSIIIASKYFIKSFQYEFVTFFQ